MRYIAGRHALFHARVRAGRSCDGHGDLLADDVFCLADGPRILDCIEFDDHLRIGDALADVAFLAMDLEHLGRADLAHQLFDEYRELSGDIWPSSLAHHHIAYRAHVRAKVDAIRAEQGAAAAADEAQRHLGLARRHLALARVRLVLIGGLPGTGKSTLAQRLEARTETTVIRSDVVRKELGFGTASYTDIATAHTYDEVLRRAATAVELGQSVILDATWQGEEWRERARVIGSATSTDVIELRCTAPRHVTEARIEARAREGSDPSDATPAVAERMSVSFDAWPQAVEIDTRVPDGGVEDALAEYGSTDQRKPRATRRSRQ
jgi:predicted kinase